MKTAIADMIVQRGMQPGDKLPSETDLCNQFGVSRIVVRQAMSQLVTEGLVYRQQGRGAFVAQQTEDSDFVGRIIGFSGDIRSRNHQVSRTILAADIREPDAKAAKALGLGPDDKVVYLRRIMSVDGVPRILVHSVLPEALVPGLLDHPLEDRSLYALLLELYGISFEGRSAGLKPSTPAPKKPRICRSKRALHLSRSSPARRSGTANTRNISPPSTGQTQPACTSPSGLTTLPEREATIHPPAHRKTGQQRD
ncbi:GntR family transcriptional regulator [Pannonibacter sp. Pt2-lr]